MIFVLATLLSWFAVGLFAALARARGWGQRVRTDGPREHLKKEGTPTMGGVAFTVVILLLWVLLVGSRGGSDIRGWAVVLMSAAMGIIGFIDDVLLVRSRMAGAPVGVRGGLRAREKFALQFIVAISFALVVARDVSATGSGFFDVILYTLAVVGSVNAVNFTDGLDGLCAGVIAICLTPLIGGSPLAMLTVGALVGYLWFNSKPASIIMGDAGSHALGGILAGLYIAHGWFWVLPVAAAYPVLAICSVVLQVVYFRRTGGKRLLKMSPLHHHLELSGWTEGKTASRLWMFTAMMTALAWALHTGA